MSDAPSVGTQVEVQGLKSRPDLNGKRGWVTAYDQDADRVEVSFDGPSHDKVKVKPANAVPVSKLLVGTTAGLSIGVCVEIVGLLSRADLNGRRGSIVSRDDVAGRVEVQLEGTTSERVKVKPGNAKIAKDNLAVGMQVEILDLQSRPELNGRQGVVVSRDMDFTGNDRLEVHLDGPNGGERIKCKPTNARSCAKKMDLTAAIEQAAATARLKAKEQEAHRPASQWDQPGSKPDDSRSWDRTRDRARDRSRSRPRSPRARSRSRPRGGFMPPTGGHPASYRAPSDGLEDRSGDWVCKCGERNFRKRDMCHRCRAPKPSEAKAYTGISHEQEVRMKAQQAACAAQMAQRLPRPMGGPLGDWKTAKDLLGKDDLEYIRRRVDERSARKEKKRKKTRVSSSSSSSSRSPSSASSEKSFSQVASEVTKATTELDKLKNTALQRLLKLRDEPIETRKRSWRALLLEWHPDKHPEDTENATAVFQFLQKGKSLVDLKSA